MAETNVHGAWRHLEGRFVYTSDTEAAAAGRRRPDSAAALAAALAFAFGVAWEETCCAERLLRQVTPGVRGLIATAALRDRNQRLMNSGTREQG